jgi:sugar/nucleoside kinase (ribokinase family)
LDSLKGKELSETLRYANAVAAMVITEFGAMSVLPTEEQVGRFIRGGEI